MVDQPPRLSSCEPGFAMSPHPIWVMDMDSMAFHWVNDAALELWQAPNRDELFARDTISEAPHKVLARLQDLIERVRAGERMREEWAFYPRGKPMLVLLDLCAITMDDGRLGLLTQVIPIEREGETSASVKRTISIARHVSVICALVGPDGAILSQNPAALAYFGRHDAWTEWFAEPERAERIIAAALDGEFINTGARVHALSGLRWNTIEAERLRDPVTGVQSILVEHRDETARVEAEDLAETRQRRIDDLDAALELVERQRNEILALSAPILDVGAATLAVPIVGRFDDDQSVALSTKLLEAVSERRVRRVILDLTGVGTIDEANSSRLRQLVRALRLLGAEPVLTGVRPDVARLLADASATLFDVPTLRSLAVALRRLA